MVYLSKILQFLINNIEKLCIQKSHGRDFALESHKAGKFITHKQLTRHLQVASTLEAVQLRDIMGIPSSQLTR